jgi:hypothetical protein
MTTREQIKADITVIANFDAPEYLTAFLNASKRVPWLHELALEVLQSMNHPQCTLDNAVGEDA